MVEICTVMCVFLGSAKCARHSEARPPIIEEWTDWRMERSDRTALLACRASGQPMPKTAWYKVSEEGGEERITTGDDYEVRSNVPIVACCVRDSDSGVSD